MSDQRDAKIWVAVNHNFTALHKQPKTYDEAAKELEEYTFMTGNAGAVVQDNEEGINW